MNQRRIFAGGTSEGEGPDARPVERDLSIAGPVVVGCGERLATEDVEAGIGQGARDTKSGQRRPDRAEQEPLRRAARLRAGQGEADDERLRTGAGEAADGEVEEMAGGRDGRYEQRRGGARGGAEGVADRHGVVAGVGRGHAWQGEGGGGIVRGDGASRSGEGDAVARPAVSGRCRARHDDGEGGLEADGHSRADGRGGDRGGRIRERDGEARVGTGDGSASIGHHDRIGPDVGQLNVG